MPPPLNQNLRLREYNSLLYCPNSRNETFAFQKSETSTVYVGSAQNGLHVSTRSGGRFGEDVDRPLLSDHSPIVAVHR